MATVSKRYFTVCAIVLVLLGILGLIGCIFLIAENRDVAQWPATAGELTKAEIGEELDIGRRGRSPGTEYFPRVSYRYRIDGIEYKGDALAQGRVESRDRAEVERWLRETLGPQYDSAPRPITVYYDRAHPERSLLDRADYSDAQTGLLWFSMGSILCAIYMFVRGRFLTA